LLSVSGFLLRLVRRKVPATCSEHLAGTAWLAGEARAGRLQPTPERGVTRSHKFLLWHMNHCVLICSSELFQNNDVCINLRSIWAKTLVSPHITADKQGGRNGLTAAASGRDPGPSRSRPVSGRPAAGPAA